MYYVMLSVATYLVFTVILNVVMLSAAMLNVVAPQEAL
jgi:hypothetical protein